MPRPSAAPPEPGTRPGERTGGPGELPAGLTDDEGFEDGQAPADPEAKWLDRLWFERTWAERLGYPVAWAGRAALLLAAVVVPWTWGGVLPAERADAALACAIGAACAAVAAVLLRGTGRVPGFAVLLGGAAAVGGAQLWFGQTPALGPMADLFGGGPGAWEPATTSAAATRAVTGDMLVAAAAVALGAALFSRLRPRRVLCWAIAGTAAAMAFLGVAGLVQPAASVFPDPGVGRPFGAFVNRNSACLLLAAGAAAALTLAADPSLGSKRSPAAGAGEGGWTGPRLFAGLLALTCCAAAVASGSRGGALAVAVGGAATLAAVRLGSGKWANGWRGALVRLGGGVVAAGLAVLLVGWLDLLGRLSERVTGEKFAPDNPDLALFDPEQGGRLGHWVDVSPALVDRPAWGFGLGTYAHSYLPYQDVPGSRTFVHADGMAIEWLLEVGAVGTAAILLGGLWALWAGWRRARGAVTDPVSEAAAAVAGGPRPDGGRLPVGPLSAAGLGAVVLLAAGATSAAFDFGITLAGCYLPGGLLLGALAAAKVSPADRRPEYVAAPELKPVLRTKSAARSAARSDAADTAETAEAPFRHAPPAAAPATPAVAGRRPVARIRVRGADDPPDSAAPAGTDAPAVLVARDRGPSRSDRSPLPTGGPRAKLKAVVSATPAAGPAAAPAYRRSVRRNRLGRAGTAAACVALAVGCRWAQTERAAAAVVDDAVRFQPDPKLWQRTGTPPAERAALLAFTLPRLEAALAARPDDPGGLAALAAGRELAYRADVAARLAPVLPELTPNARWRLTRLDAVHQLSQELYRARGTAGLEALASDPTVAAHLPGVLDALRGLAAADPWHPGLNGTAAELAFLSVTEPPVGPPLAPPADVRPGAEPADVADEWPAPGGPDVGGLAAIRRGHVLMAGRAEAQESFGRLAWSAGAPELATACWRRALRLFPATEDVLPDIAARLRLEPDWPQNFVAVLPDDPAVLAAASVLRGPAVGRGNEGARRDPGAAALIDRLFPPLDIAPPPETRALLTARARALIAAPGVDRRTRAAVLATMEQFDEARAEYETLLTEDADDFLGRLDYARFLRDRGDLREAAGQARDARAIAGSRGASTNRADRLLWEIGRQADAAERALEEGLRKRHPERTGPRPVDPLF